MRFPPAMRDDIKVRPAAHMKTVNRRSAAVDYPEGQRRRPRACHMPYDKRPRWSPEEDGRATEWRAAGLSWSEIAARLGRPETAVRSRLQARGTPLRQIEKIPADVLADRDARAQARFDAQEANPLSLLFGDPVRPPIRRNG
jgi:hypothetical protein